MLQCHSVHASLNDPASKPAPASQNDTAFVSKDTAQLCSIYACMLPCWWLNRFVSQKLASRRLEIHLTSAFYFCFLFLNNSLLFACRPFGWCRPSLCILQQSALFACALFVKKRAQARSLAECTLQANRHQHQHACISC